MVSPIFFPEKNDDLFLVIAVCKVIKPPELVCPLFFLESATFFFIPFGCQPSPLEGVTRGGPPSDATAGVHSQAYFHFQGCSAKR